MIFGICLVYFLILTAGLWTLNLQYATMCIMLQEFAQSDRKREFRTV